MFEGGKMKAVTFSFDDGVNDDVRLVKLFNKYGIKCTFNLNGGMMTGTIVRRFADVKDVRRLNYFEIKDLYNGHEIACHGYAHANLCEYTGAAVDNEIRLDKYVLEYLFNTKINGMAYPYGTHNDEIVKTISNIGIKYARTVEETNDFKMPPNPLLWNPTCRFNCKEVLCIAKRFVEAVPTEPMLLYIWGHSYELVTEDDWERFENLLKYLSNREDVFYGTNSQILGL